MSSPRAEGDNKKRLDIVFSLIKPVREYLLKKEKNGEATKVTSYSEKEAETKNDIIKQPNIDASVSTYQWGYDENNLPVRIVNGKKIRINEDRMKELVENRKKLELKRGLKIKDNKKEKGQEK